MEKENRGVETIRNITDLQQRVEQWLGVLKAAKSKSIESSNTYAFYYSQGAIDVLNDLQAQTAEAEEDRDNPDWRPELQ